MPSSEPEHHHAPPPSHHGRRRGGSDDPLSKPRVPVDARDDGEHVTGDLADGEFLPVKALPLFCFTIMWGRVDYGTHTSVIAGCIDRVHLAFGV